MELKTYLWWQFYSHVNYSVTKIPTDLVQEEGQFYSHVNYSVTKIAVL